MKRHRKALAFSILALAVPLPAFAVQTATEGHEPSLAVSVSLDRCGLVATQITCRIDASWNPIEDADHYSVTVIRPDGSVSEMGDVEGTSASLWVEYTGSGNYSVEVSAWGNGAESELLATQRVGKGPKKHRIGNFTIGTSGDRPGTSPGPTGAGDDPAQTPATGPVNPEEPAGCEPAPSELDEHEETTTVATTTATPDSEADADPSGSEPDDLDACPPAS